MPTELDSNILASLQTSYAFSGKVISPSDPAYSESLARWATNAQRPASAVVLPHTTQDVSAAVRWAVANGIPIAVCGGGHSASGASSIGEGGVVIDLGKYVKELRVDVEGRKAYVGGGAVWKDVDEACIVHGLASVGGTVNRTGVGGLTLGGGFGFLTGEYGLVIDNVLEATVVTADGSILKANQSEHPDLFWGIRGGGGNFGIVTEFVYQLHPQDRTVFTGMLTYIATEPTVQGVFDFIQKWWNGPERSPKEAVVVFLANVNKGGPPVMLVIVFYNGPEEKGKPIFQPLFDLGPTGNSVRQRPYEELNTLQNDIAVPGRGIFMTATSLAPHGEGVPMVLYKELVEHVDHPTVRLMIMFEFFGTDVANAVANDATAYPSRGVGSNVMVQGIFDGSGNYGDLQEKAGVARKLAGSIKKIVTEKVGMSNRGDVAPYGNYETEEKPPVSRSAAVFKHNYPRLQEVKAKYDPNQVFSRWFGIAPA